MSNQPVQPGINQHTSASSLGGGTGSPYAQAAQSGTAAGNLLLQLFPALNVGGQFQNAAKNYTQGLIDYTVQRIETFGPEILIGALLIIVMLFAAYMFLKE